MFSPEPTWKEGLKDDLRTKDLYGPFERLLGDLLPMKLGELAEQVGKDRTTVSKWKSGDLKPKLEQQREVVEEVRSRLKEIEEQVGRVEQMIAALEDVRAAHEEHQGSYDSETLEALNEANDRVRHLLEAEEP